MYGDKCWLIKVILLQYIHILNHYVVYLKLIQYYLKPQFLRKLILREGFLENIIDYSPSKSSVCSNCSAVLTPLKYEEHPRRKELQKQVDF